MSGPIPYEMKIGVEAWRMPPRTRGASYTTADLKECKAICDWLNSLYFIDRDGATFRNRPFDKANPHGKPGPCIMITGQFTVWRVDPGDYIVHLPSNFDKKIEVVGKVDFQAGFKKL